MAFVQMVEFRSSDIGAIRKAGDDWSRATEGKRTARRLMLTRDHDDPDRYFMIVFFDSYESAMVNSGLPETKASANEFAALSDGAPKFYDLDVVDDQT